MHYTIQTGNIVLIVVGVRLVLSGPVIVWRTLPGSCNSVGLDPAAKLHLFSNGINFLIAVFLFIAGILFIINNLKGNPLA